MTQTETAEQEPPLLWRPGAARIAGSAITRYLTWLHETRGLSFDGYDALWRWSVDQQEAFWSSLWDYFQIKAATPYRNVLENPVMPGARWFAGATLNIVDQVFRHETADRPAILYASETAPLRQMSWAELRAHVAAFAQFLRDRGVRAGDRVAAYAPNVPETMIAFMGAAAIGAVWSVCSPDMGHQAVFDRFTQIEPSVLIATPCSHNAGRVHDRRPMMADLAAHLPSLRQIVVLPGPIAMAVDRQTLPAAITVTDWADALAKPAALTTDPVPFDHPLWVVYSSGTTGLPKPIVHGQGGILIEMLKMQHLQNDIGPEDVFHWYSSTGWIMWNAQFSGLLVGATIALYDGAPSWPDWGVMWRFAAQTKLTVFGAGAAYYASCLKAEIDPHSQGDLTSIRTIGSTGSPLSADSYRWIYRYFPDAWLTPISGGTDFAGAFVGGCILLPVYEGEMQCRCLGASIEAFDDDGAPLNDAVGELVCTKPMPSMPLYFWNDRDGERYRSSYFDMYPGVWRHGDWLRITKRGGAVIYGRSDATINRHGLRLGTAEIYRAVEELPEVQDSLVVDLEHIGRASFMPLFVVMKPGLALDAAMRDRIVHAIRTHVSARFVPNDIVAIEDVPRTLSGKKLEVPVKKILLGHAADKVVNPATVANPAALDFFLAYAAKMEAGSA